MIQRDFWGTMSVGDFSATCLEFHSVLRLISCRQRPCWHSPDGRGRQVLQQNTVIIKHINYYLESSEHVRKPIIKHMDHIYEDLFAPVKRQKPKWYGDVTRSDHLTKVIFQGTFEGKRRRGRSKKRWSDNIAECTGKFFT